MLRKLRAPSPALVISLIALFVALGGTGTASTSIVALAKRALTADRAKTATTANTAKVATLARNSLLLGGQTAAQVAATPGPADTLNGQTAAQIIAAASQGGSIVGKFTIRSQGWAIESPGTQGADWYANCNAGEKAVGGGYDETVGEIIPQYSRPKADGSGWWFKAQAFEDASLPAHGSVWVVCAS